MPSAIALRFSPRRPKSNWTATNLERARRMIAQSKKMTRAGPPDAAGQASWRRPSEATHDRLPRVRRLSASARPGSTSSSSLEYVDPAYGAVHHLTVAAYMLQHSSQLSREGWLLRTEAAQASSFERTPSRLTGCAARSPLTWTAGGAGSRSSPWTASRFSRRPAWSRTIHECSSRRRHRLTGLTSPPGLGLTLDGQRASEIGET